MTVRISFWDALQKKIYYLNEQVKSTLLGCNLFPMEFTKNSVFFVSSSRTCPSRIRKSEVCNLWQIT